MEKNIDKYGLLVQPVNYLPSGQDGGDSLKFTAIYYYLSGKGNIDVFNSAFESHNYPGLYVRHPFPRYSIDGWASWCAGNWHGVESRDQATSKLAYFAIEGHRKSLWRSFREHLKRGLLFANNNYKNGRKINEKDWKLGDLTLFDIWALYIRGFRCWPLYCFLLIFDLQLLGAAIINRFKKHDDPLSFIDKMIVANEIMPTPIVWLANCFLDKFKTYLELCNYYGGWRQRPEMVDLYGKYLDKYWH